MKHLPSNSKGPDLASITIYGEVGSIEVAADSGIALGEWLINPANAGATHVKLTGLDGLIRYVKRTDIKLIAPSWSEEVQKVDLSDAEMRELAGL